jgi:hypothetical protein
LFDEWVRISAIGLMRVLGLYYRAECRGRFIESPNGIPRILLEMDGFR